VNADLDPQRLARDLRTARFGRSLRVLDVTDSTNDDARRDALAGAPDGHVVVADSQRAGRGSHGRTWTSPAGSDLYLSIVARPQLALAALPPLTLAVGLGVADAVQALLPEHVAHDGSASIDGDVSVTEVKWPNDVWLLGKKCAGVLVEASTLGSELGPVVIGIGLNVNRLQWADGLEASATSLRVVGSGAKLDRGAALCALLLSVEGWVDRLVAQGGQAIAAALDARLAMRGQRVRCAECEGTLLGVAASGAIRIATALGTRELIAGRLEASTT
jgi:BirA family biotin operon repressor/biotin-[acetyl-CoA-carboxylase] ligase